MVVVCPSKETIWSSAHNISLLSGFSAIKWLTLIKLKNDLIDRACMSTFLKMEKLKSHIAHDGPGHDLKLHPANPPLLPSLGEDIHPKNTVHYPGFGRHAENWMVVLVSALYGTSAGAYAGKAHAS